MRIWTFGPGAALLALAAVNVIWGVSFPVTKPALETIPPFTFAFLRFALAMAFLLPLGGGQALRLLRGPDRRLLIAMGLLGFCVAQIAQTVALKLSTASDVALLATSSPLWIAVFASYWLRERLGRRGTLGFALALCGLLIILWPRADASQDFVSRVVGDAIFLVSAFSWACYNVIGKAIMTRSSPLAVTAAAGLVGTVAIVPFALVEFFAGQTARVTPLGVGGVVYNGLLVTVVGFLVLSWALTRITATRAGILMYLQPLSGVLLAWSILGESLSAEFLAGATLVLAGVAVVTIGDAAVASVRETRKWLVGASGRQ